MQHLLESAIFPPKKAIISWKKFLEHNDLQILDSKATSLLPLVYCNLKENSHPLCKSIYRYTWLKNQSLWQKTLPTLQKLFDAGIEKIAILKGMAMILSHYKDFGARTLGDIDFLIDPVHVPLAHKLLSSWGWECKLPRFNPQNPYQLTRWHSANYTHPSGLYLDLHWSLLLETPPALTQAVLQSIPQGIHPVGSNFLFFQTCIHGYKKSTAPLIRWIPDAVYLLKNPIDFPFLFKLAKEARLTLPFSSALTVLKNFCPMHIPTFSLKPSLTEKLELWANMKGRTYLAGYFRSRLRGESLLHYLQHTANLPTVWHVPLYAPYWIVKRIGDLLHRLSNR